MRRLFIFCNLIGMLANIGHASAAAAPRGDVPVEVTQIKDMGLSDSDESKSVIEVRWSADPDQREIIVWFNLTLTITYADGTTINEKRKISKQAQWARIEVPSVKTQGSRSAAFIKKIDARVTAVISKNQ